MKILSLFFTMFLALSCFAQKGIVKESLKVKSNAMGKDVEYSIYLPPDYETSNRSYPVLYLLHGFSDDETGWTQFGEVAFIADKAINSGAAPSMIIVMPDAGVTWYVNSYDGKQRYEDFFIKEFLPQIESAYRIRPKKEYRAIAGLSMGGHGSLILALKNPDLFAAVAPLSAGVLTNEEIINTPDDRWSFVFGTPYGKDLKGKDRISDHYNKNSVLPFIQAAKTDDLKKLRYYIDCGDDDFLIKGNMALHALLIDKQVPHEFRVREGGHTWTYWREALPEVMKFIGESFHR